VKSGEKGVSSGSGRFATRKASQNHNNQIKPARKQYADGSAETQPARLKRLIYSVHKKKQGFFSKVFLAIRKSGIIPRLGRCELRGKRPERSAPLSLPANCVFLGGAVEFGAGIRYPVRVLDADRVARRGV
jgi:hypothetical protein